MLGVEAGVVAAYREIKRLVGMAAVDRRHLSLFSDFMFVTGQPLPFSRHGMKAAGAGPVQRALYETPLATLAEAAVVGAEDKLTGITPQIFAGRVVSCGTGYSDVVLDLDAQARRTR